MTPQQVNQALYAVPAPAPDVVEVNRENAESLLSQLEGMGMAHAIVDDLRMALCVPKAELWAVYSAGPDETWPALDRDHAEQIAEETTRKVNEALKEMGLDVKVQNVVIPSPWTPAQHYQEVAEQMSIETLSYRQIAKTVSTERDQLAAEVVQLKKTVGAN